MIQRLARATTSLALCTVCAFVLALFASATALAGDVCYAENDGPDYDDGSSTSNAMFGIRFVAASSIAVNRVEMFTGEVVAGMSVAIWSHDEVNDQPLVPLSLGSFGTTLPVGWQGGNVTPAAMLSAGTTYWLAWGTVAGAQSSIDLPGAENGQAFRVSLDGGTTWGPLLQSMERHFKFRFVCGCASPGAEYGAGCAGSAAIVPHLTLITCPAAGEMLSISIEQALGGTNALFFFGLNPAAVPVGGTGCTLLTAPVFPFVVTVPLGGSGPGNGSFLLGGVLPAAAAGATFRVQAFVADAGVPSGFSNSNAITVAVP